MWHDYGIDYSVNGEATVRVEFYPYKDSYSVQTDIYDLEDFDYIQWDRYAYLISVEIVGADERPVSRRQYMKYRDEEFDKVGKYDYERC